MSTNLSSNFLNELGKNSNKPNTVIEIELDSGTKKYGLHSGGFSDVTPVLRSVSTLQNKLDTKKGISTRGSISVTLVGRDNFKGLVRDEYLKNRRVIRKDGYVAQGFQYSDYAVTFTGVISDWSRNGDELTLTISDDLMSAKKKLPEENSTKTQYIDYRNTNPVDIIKDIVIKKLSLAGILSNGDFEVWSAGTGSAPDDWALSGAGAVIAREQINFQTGIYSAKLTYGSATAMLTHSVTAYSLYKNKQVSFGCWVKSSVATQARLRIDDGVATTDSSYHTGGGEWEFLTVTRTISGSSTKLDFSLMTEAAGALYFDTAVARIGPSVIAFDLNVDERSFYIEKDRWFNNWTFDRVITKPEEVNKYLGELQVETNAFLYHDGNRVNFQAFAPPFLDETISQWNDTNHILHGSLSCKSGYADAFYNRIVIYYDYDESGSGGDENFGSALISVAADSQDETQWNEVKTKVVKSKWIRTRTYTQPTNITGVTIYHLDSSNPVGKGYLRYNADGTIQWRASDGSGYGEAVTITETKKYQVFGLDKIKYIRIIVDTANIPSVAQADEITISHLSGDLYARVLAGQLLRRFKNPVSSISFEVDINHLAEGSVFRKITDLVDLTTDEAFEFGDSTWVKERVMLTFLRPDYLTGRAKIEGAETKIYTNNYGYIAPVANTNDWDAANADEKKYAFVGDTNNQLGTGNDPGFIVW